MHEHHEVFLAALHGKQRVLLHFFSKEDQTIMQRACAPMDFGPSRRAKDKSDRYHLWDFESDSSNHVLSLLPVQVSRIELQEVPFDPIEFITWNVSTSPWFTERDWGQFS